MASISQPAAPEEIKISIKDIQRDESLFFTIMRDQPIRKVLRAYSRKKGIDYSIIKFHIDGKRFRLTHTPDQLNLEDGVEIEAFIYQTGGGY